MSPRKTLAIVAVLAAWASAASALEVWPTSPTVPLKIADTAADEVLTDFSSDGYYGVVAAWEQDGDEAHAQRLDPNGEKQWGADTRVCTSVSSTQTRPACTHNGARGAFLAWTDDRLSPTQFKSIYLQERRAGGTRVFTDGSELAVSVKKLTGTLTFDGTTTVTGTGTKFLTEIQPGAFLRPVGGAGLWHQVAAITNDTRLTLMAVAAALSDVEVEATYDCTHPRVLYCSDGAGQGGCFVVWRNNTTVLDTATKDVPLIEMAYVAYEEGASLPSVVWRADVAWLHPDREPRLFADGSGGIILAWDQPATVWAGEALLPPTCTWATRMSRTGEAVWEEAPRKLWQSQSGSTEAAEVASDGAGGLWLCGRWQFPNDRDNGPMADDGWYVVVNH